METIHTIANPGQGVKRKGKRKNIPWFILRLPHKRTHCVSDAVRAEHDGIRRDLHYTRPHENGERVQQRLDRRTRLVCPAVTLVNQDKDKTNPVELISTSQIPKSNPI